MTIPGRIQVSDPNGHRVVIGPRRNWFAAALGVCAVIAYFISAPFLFSDVLSKPHDGPSTDAGAILFSGIFAAISTIVVGALLANAIWTLWGRCELILEDGSLSIIWQIFRFKRSRTYRLDAIRKVRRDETQGRGTLVTRTIKFEHDGEDVVATPSLSAEEADFIIRGIFKGLLDH